MITPSDSPSSPSDYADVATSSFAILAPQDEAGIASAAAGAVAESGRGSPRQDATASLIASAPGYADFDILGGFTGGWPADTAPADSD